MATRRRVSGALVAWCAGVARDSERLSLPRTRRGSVAAPCGAAVVKGTSTVASIPWCPRFLGRWLRPRRGRPRRRFVAERVVISARMADGSAIVELVTGFEQFINLVLPFRADPDVVRLSWVVLNLPRRDAGAPLPSIGGRRCA